MDGLVCATDAGREGELIFRFVYQMAGCKKPFQAALDFQYGGHRHPGGLCQPENRGADYDNLYQSAPVPGAGRLAGGDQRHPAFLHPLPQDPDRGPGTDTDPENAG